MKNSTTVSNNKLEATMVKVFASNGSRTSVIFIKSFNTHALYKALRDEKFLPSESVGKTSSVSIEEGKALTITFKDISVDVEVVFDVSATEEVFLTATAEQQASASGESYGLSTNFGLVAKGELYFVEFDGESKKAKMVGAEAHTGAYLAQLNKREQKRAARLAKSKDLHNLEVIKTLKKLDLDVASMDKELLALIAEQALDLETSPNAYLHNDGQDEVKVKVQRFNPESGRWYNAKTKDKRPMVTSFPVESVFEFDVDGRIVGMKINDFGQTAIAHSIEEDFNTTCVHNYHYIDKATNELVFKSIEQRFLISGKAVNSDAVIDGENLKVSEGSSQWTVNKEGEVVKQFQFFGYDDLVDVGEGFYLAPSEDELTGVDIENQEYSDGIVLGNSVCTASMSLNDQARSHIRSTKQEESELNLISKRESRGSNTRAGYKASVVKGIKESELYTWVLDRKEKTYKALKNAKLQAELNEEFNAMKDQAEDILECLKVILAESGSGYARPSWVVVNALASKPKKDEKKASEEDFRSQVKKHILENIDAINNGSLDIAELHDEVVSEIYDVCKAGLKSGVSIKDKAVALKMRDIAQKVKPVALPTKGSPRNSDVRDVKVS